MKCPVCKTECSDSVKCPTCGFDQLDIELLNRDEAVAWIENVVKPLREKYFNRILNINNDEFEIENGVLKKYKGHASDVVVPYGITSIGDKAFYDCKSLTAIHIPGSVTSIGDWVFHNCENLTAIDIPDSVTSIGNEAFYGCKNLTSIIIPNGVTSIGEYAFIDCKKLTAIHIPGSVTYIGEMAFAGCKSLSIISIPNSVVAIGAYPFYGCKKIKLLLQRKSYAEEYAIKHRIDYEVSNLRN